MKRSIPAVLALSTLGLSVFACSSHDFEAREPLATPDPAVFTDVAPVLVYRCGSLDCHGSAYRNLRLYGYGGLRLDPSDRPDSRPYAMTEDELRADYEAVVGLEPERTREVASGHALVDTLTIVRKARGAEGHKGNAVFAVGEDGDVCMTSWLQGRSTIDACHRALPWFGREDAGADADAGPDVGDAGAP
jgi:hypothetical protein